MSQIRFIHCADLHIDSPFQGLSEIHPELRELLYNSTFQSFNNIVNIAKMENVDCVLIAGDVYDGADKSLQAQLRFRKGLHDLSQNGIPTFVVHGNHDSLDSWYASLDIPPSVTIFGGDEVQCVPLEKGGDTLAYVFGISYPKRDVYDNLSLLFERKDDSLPAIALLHANIGENTGHEPYAPASIEDLASRGMDYWALGHVHNHTILREYGPAVVYPGCTQARNPRETGAKGCCLVTLDTNGGCEIEFVPIDVVRYESLIVDISDCDSLDDVIRAITDTCEFTSDKMDGRHAILRLSLTGKTEIHDEVRKGKNVDDLLVEVRDHFEDKDPKIWVDKITLNTCGTYDLDLLRKRNDFVADIISLYDGFEDDGSEKWEKIDQILEPLFSDWRGYRLLDKPTKQELLEMAIQARDATLDELLRGR